jgi:hypothetical protein
MVQGNQVLIVKGKADERNTEIQVIVDSIHRSMEVAVASPSASPEPSRPSTPAKSSPPPRSAPPKNTSVQPKLETRHSEPPPPPQHDPRLDLLHESDDFMEEDPFADAPILPLPDEPPFDEGDWEDYGEIPTPPPIIQTSVQRAETSSSNIQNRFQRNGKNGKAEPKSTPTPEPRPQRRLSVYLERSGNPQTERLRLERVVRTLRSYPGQDKVRVLVDSTAENRVVQLSFPFTIKITDELLTELRQFNVTDEFIQIETLSTL